MEAVDAPDASFADERGVFHFSSRMGHKLVGVLTLKNPRDRRVVLLCHGLLSSKENAILVALAKKLQLNSVRFDFHGNGESEGIEAWSFGGYIEETDDDIAAAVHFLRKKSFDVVALFGHSRGGNDVLLYGHRHGEIPLIVAAAARFDMSTGVEKYLNSPAAADFEATGRFPLLCSDGRSRQVTRKTLDDRLKLDMSVVGKMKGGVKKVLIVHGTADEVTPFEHAHRFQRLFGSEPTAEVKEIVGGSHCFYEDEENFEDVVSSVKKFLEDNAARPPETA